jgi:hypothetical protein
MSGGVVLISSESIGKNSSFSAKFLLFNSFVMELKGKKSHRTKCGLYDAPFS